MNFTGERVVPEKMGVDIKTYNEHLARYIFSLTYCVGKHVIDAACGVGYGSYILASVAKFVLGLDVDKETISYSRDNFKPLWGCVGFDECDFEVDSLSSLPSGEECDVVVSFETIEHLANPDFFLSNVKNALRPGGKFIFSIPRMSFVRFHKEVYDLQAAQSLIKKHFPECDWYSQDGFSIGPLREYSQFFIGVATK